MYLVRFLVWARAQVRSVVLVTPTPLIGAGPAFTPNLRGEDYLAAEQQLIGRCQFDSGSLSATSAPLTLAVLVERSGKKDD